MLNLSPKLAIGLAGLVFYCPACKEIHSIPTQEYNPNNNSTMWKFDGNIYLPTITPSIRVHLAEAKVCHLFLSHGILEYLGDCWHDLRNSKIPLPDLPEWVISDTGVQHEEAEF